MLSPLLRGEDLDLVSREAKDGVETAGFTMWQLRPIGC